MSERQTRSFSELYEELERDPAYWADRAVLDFTDELARLMDEQQVSRAELARRIGSSQAYVTKALNSRANFTIASMTKLALALGSELRLHLAPRHSVTHWFDEITSYVPYREAASKPIESTMTVPSTAQSAAPEPEYNVSPDLAKEPDAAFPPAA